jgi:hypothetical protein
VEKQKTHVLLNKLHDFAREQGHTRATFTTALAAVGNTDYTCKRDYTHRKGNIAVWATLMRDLADKGKELRRLANPFEHADLVVRLLGGGVAPAYYEVEPLTKAERERLNAELTAAKRPETREEFEELYATHIRRLYPGITKGLAMLLKYW